MEIDAKRLKQDIEKTREKLNLLMNQNTLDITDEILVVSQKLDTLINEYYWICQTGF